MNWFLTSVVSLTLFTPCINTQQKYVGTAASKCTRSGETDASESFLYSCNGESSSCRAFLIFAARSPFNTVPTIATLTSSDQTEIMKINNATRYTVFKTEQEVVVPVNCTCSGRYYQAISTYQVLGEHETYRVISNDTFQGLSTCQSIKLSNIDVGFKLVPGSKLRVPLRCSCPTRGQVLTGTKYLLTYSISMGDTLYGLSKRFNVSLKSITEANSFPDERFTIYPLTTILIPMPREPSSSNTVTRGYKVRASTFPAHVARKHMSKKVLSTAGISAGVFSLVIFLSLPVIFLCYKNNKPVLEKRGRNEKYSPEDLVLEIARLERVLKVFKFTEVKKATGNFREKRRIKGEVYRGTFGRDVLAVEKIAGDSRTAVKILYQINHFNIIKLHGFSEHKDDTYFVYEYMENGSLQEWLGRRGSDSKKGWNERIRIALDVANGLLYLHNFMKPAYVHNDIRSSNILLDSNLRAKIANFSLARKANSDDVITRIVGTEAYRAPEHMDTGPIPPRVDVYAFGVVLLELFTGKNAVFVQDGKEKLLSSEVAAIVESENSEAELTCFIELSLAENGGIVWAIQVVKLSLSCLEQDPENRPSMVEVVSVLLKLQLNMQKPSAVALVN
ncbi:protein LYK5-like [Primulina huaijiensis]|uniref:protein LYK5-like n=1 Tax=Primulina huaijiensis TaxID=1492673 RepID=UPI003CC7866E